MRRRQRANQVEATPDEPAGHEPAAEFSALLTTELGRTEPVPGVGMRPAEYGSSREPVIDLADDRPEPSPTLDFWDRYDEARAMADLLDVPPTTAVAVVGPLELAIPVVRRCLDDHPLGDCDVFVLTELEDIPDEPNWTTLHRAPDLVAALEHPGLNAPLLVLDVPRELPPAIRPLIARLRQAGLSMVRYVLDVSPDDEDLATWHGELGRPSVLDLAAPVAPDRALELLERGEPIASIDGVTVAAELILALRFELLS